MLRSSIISYPKWPFYMITGSSFWRLVSSVTKSILRAAIRLNS